MAQDIVYENGAFYVARNRRCNALTVFRPSDSGTHAISDSSYCNTENGLSIATARCDYLAKRDTQRLHAVHQRKTLDELDPMA